MEVLCSYVRWNAPWPPDKFEYAIKKRPWAKKRDKDLPQETPETDIQAVLTVLARTAIPFAQKGEKRHLDLSATDLAGAYLEEANLEKSFFYKANLQGAYISHTNLQGAWLIGANLQGAIVIGANAQMAGLSESNLQVADLGGANLQGAGLNGANLQGADLRGADLTGPIYFIRNWVAKGLTAEQVAGAYWDWTTKWPKGFSPPAPERLPPKEEMQKKE